MRHTVSSVNKAFLLLTLALLPGARSLAQQPGGPDSPGGFGQFASMQRVMGEITAVMPDKLSVKAEDGVYQVVTTSNTRLMRSTGPFKVADLKPGEGVVATGNMDAPNKTLHAAMLIALDAEQMKKIADARKQLAANLGKTLIMGRVKSIDIDNLKMTVERPDNVTQTIGFDESTSFRRATGRGGMGMGAGGGDIMMMMRGDGAANPRAGANPAADAGEPITLADIKVGDAVNGLGAVKNGVFIPTQLSVRTPRAGAQRREGQGAGPGQQAPSPGSTSTPR